VRNLHRGPRAEGKDSGPRKGREGWLGQVDRKPTCHQNVGIEGIFYLPASLPWNAIYATGTCKVTTC